jgi:hypothetical protein
MTPPTDSMIHELRAADDALPRASALVTLVLPDHEPPIFAWEIARKRALLAPALRTGERVLAIWTREWRSEVFLVSDVARVAAAVAPPRPPAAWPHPRKRVIPTRRGASG